MAEFIQAGAGSYRTRLFPITEAAFRFGRCLHNNPRFANVHVCQSRKAPGRWFVTYEPSNPQRQADLLVRQQDARARRAVAGAFIFIADGAAHWCINQETGGVYRVTEGGCDCPDAVYRLHGSGVAYKHRLMLAAYLGAGQEAQEVARQDVAAIFGEAA